MGPAVQAFGAPLAHGSAFTIGGTSPPGLDISGLSPVASQPQGFVGAAYGGPVGSNPAHSGATVQSDTERVAVLQALIGALQMLIAARDAEYRSGPPIISAPPNVPPPSSMVGAAYSEDAQSRPIAFAWNGKYFYEMAPAGGIDVNDDTAVRNRIVRSVVQHMLEYEKVDDFAITAIGLRPAGGPGDADLFQVNPNSRYVADIVATAADGTVHHVPVVMNHDGSTFVDPKVRY
jgi:hypothetical protein